MSFFMTEKQVEELLEFQTRELLMPDGSRRVIGAFKFTWDDFAFLNECACFRNPGVVEMALTNSEEVKIPFETSFAGTVTYLRRKYRESGLEN